MSQKTQETSDGFIRAIARADRILEGNRRDELSTARARLSTLTTGVEQALKTGRVLSAIHTEIDSRSPTVAADLCVVSNIRPDRLLDKQSSTLVCMDDRLSTAIRHHDWLAIGVWMSALVDHISKNTVAYRSEYGQLRKD